MIASSLASARVSSPVLRPCGHDEDAVGEKQKLREFGADHEDGEAFGGERADERVDLLLGADVDAAGGLVEEEDARSRWRATCR